MDKKLLTKRITLIALCVVVIAVIVVANCLLNYYSLVLNRFFSDNNTNIDSSGSTDHGDITTYSDGVIRAAAEDSMVLLENKDGFLPQKGLDKVNLFGWGSTDYGFLLTGGGSGGTSITDESDVKVDLTDAFVECGIQYNTELTDAYNDFSSYDADYRSGGSTGANATDSLKNPSAGFYTDSRMRSAKSFSNVAVAVISRWGAENGGDGELKNIGKYYNGDFLRLTTEEKAMFDSLQSYGFDVILVLNVCNNVEAGFVKDYSCIKACIFAGIPGQSGTIAIPKIITGEVTPSGRTSDVMVYSNKTFNPVYYNATKTGSHIVYQEDIYFGYKWYETADVENVFKDVSNSYGNGYDGVVQYPFGYGLSYTTFSKEVTFPSDIALEMDKTYTVTVKVTNTGEEAGKEVVQLYGHTDYSDGGIEKAERVLVDFVKTDTLQPGESQTVTLTFRAYDLASYDAYDRNGNDFCGYELEAGMVQLDVMENSHVKTTNGSKVFTSAGLKFENDPDTQNPVGNLFTGDTAYAGCPTDGSSVYGMSFAYLSRANGFANFSQFTRSAGQPSNTSAVASAAGFRYDGYNDSEVSRVYGQDAQMYLTRIENKDADGNVTYTKATIAQLDGTEATTLTFNTELLTTLNDYDSPFWTTFIDQMTEAEIKALIGQGGFQTVAIESVGKMRCVDKDGPSGFNNNVTNPGKSTPYPLLPSENLLGCSWSKTTLSSLGEMQGIVGTASSINGWYGPGVNLHRSVFNSRNYEYFSEDGVLSGKLAASMIAAAKENGVYCYIKHFAVSEAGQNPKNLNTWLTEQSMREGYLKAFEIALKESKGNAVMSAFNRIGATLAGYNHALLTDVLRNEWGFRGSVITDWYDGGGYMSSHELGVLAGNDLWLCGTTAQSAQLNFSTLGVAYAAKQSAKNLLYTYVSTYVTATSAKAVAEETSPLFVALWVGVDVVLVGGLVACALPLVKTFIKRKETVEAIADVVSEE